MFMGRGGRTSLVEPLVVRGSKGAPTKRLDIANVCVELLEIKGGSQSARDQRYHKLALLADSVLDNYQDRWNDRLLPFFNQLGLKGATVEQALGDPPKRWIGGYRGCALNLAREGLGWAIDKDADLLSEGSRAESKLTPSWVGENIATGWRDTYMSAALDRLEEKTPGVQWKGLCLAWKDWSKALKNKQPIDAKQALRQNSN
jgi:hypothetical protein